MTCSRCQSANRDGARFCRECGAAFGETCGRCGARVEAGTRFCDACGAPLTATTVPAPASSAPRFASPESYTPKHLADRGATVTATLEGERKQVTVLFADLKGSMELLADRDPEEALTLLDPVLELMMEAVHRYGGTVNQVMGDGIMALFGAPVAQEDHAVRACYAALRMQDAVQRHGESMLRKLGVPIRIRVGLNSGEVVVRSIGSDLRTDYSAVGQTTHLAARMEQLAEPGTVLLTAETLALAEGFVEVNARGPVPVKGLAAPVEVFALTAASRVRSRVHAAASRGLTRFVGRDAEMELLRRSLALAGQGHGQAVAIVGEPGVGKSRLVWEFTHSHRAQEWLVLETASVSYGKATTYYPIIELLRSYFTIDHADDARRMREKVTGKLLALDRVLEATLPVFLSLLDVYVDDAEWTRLGAPLRRRQTLDALKHLLLRESQVQPVLLVVEDLHWIDTETQAWLDLLVDSLPTARLLLLVNHRPTYTHAWGGKTYYRQVRLDPLPAVSAGEFLAGLLGPAPELADLGRLLTERTEGNPFFLEESVRALVETGALAGERGAYRLTRPIRTLEFPATVQAILATRIDRLVPEDKRLLQAAAVVGKDVPYALLAAIRELPEEDLRQGLGRLQAAELVYEAGLFPDLEYTFAHALTLEVAYGGLLQERRSALHARLVAAIEALYADRLDEHAERLAHHAVRGGLKVKAVRYARQAGQKAAARSALAEARTWLDQALEVLEELPGDPVTLGEAVDIRLELRPILGRNLETQRARERLAEAVVLAEQLSDDRRRGRVYAALTNVQAITGELDAAVGSGTRALALARALGDRELGAATAGFLVQAYHYRGEYQEAIALGTAHLDAVPAEWICEYVGNAVPGAIEVHIRVWLAMSLAQLGRFSEAVAHEAEAIRLAEPTHDAYNIAFAHFAAGTLHPLRGDWSRGRVLLERGLAAYRSGNIRQGQIPALAASAWALAELGEQNEALVRIREAEELLGRTPPGRVVALLGWAFHVLGRAWLRLDRLDEADRMARRAAEALPAHPGFGAHAHHLLGDLASHPCRFDADAAEAHYRDALVLAEPRGMRPLIAFCHLGLARLHAHVGGRAQSLEHLSVATRALRELDMPWWLEQAEALTIS